MPDHIDDEKTGEIVTVPTPGVPRTAMDMLASLGLQVVKQVTRTVLQQKEDVPICVTFEGPIFESEIQQGEGRGGKPKMANARVAHVVNIVTGSHQILICNTVMEGELNRNYPDDAFVGKTFLMRSHFPADANAASGKKSYKVYEIIEVAMTGDAERPVEGKTVIADGSEPVNRAGKTKS